MCLQVCEPHLSYQVFGTAVLCCLLDSVTGENKWVSFDFVSLLVLTASLGRGRERVAQVFRKVAVRRLVHGQRIIGRESTQFVL